MEVRSSPLRTDPALLVAAAMGVDVVEVNALAARFGREAEPPGRKDHKLAAAAALGVLGREVRW